MKKRKRLLTAIAAVSLICALAAGAILAGNGNGYEKTFDAFEKFLFETKNVTIPAECTVLLDGEKIMNTQVLFLMDGANRLESTAYDEGFETLSVTYDGVTYYDIDDENKTYRMYRLFEGSMPASEALLEDSESTRSFLRLLRLYADFVAGDLKNRFEWQRENGSDQYTVRADEKQLPEVIVTVLDIFRGLRTQSQDAQGEVDFESEQDAFKAYYLKRTGEELSGDFFEAYYHNDELLESYRKLREEMNAHYEAMLSDDISYIYVDEDGNANMYRDREAYYKTLTLTAETLTEYGTECFVRDFTIENAEFCTVIDKDGRFESASFSASVGFTDFAGEKHMLSVSADAKFENYGSTSVEMIDLDGYEEYRYENKEAETVTVETEVRFDGKTYPVRYTKRAEE